MKRATLLFLITFSGRAACQDTFSILGIDSITGDVGAAGASCVDLFDFSWYSNDFICELVPNVGAIATQAYYEPGNQHHAMQRMLAGDTPQQIIDWLKTHDTLNNPTFRQYGVVKIVE